MSGILALYNPRSTHHQTTLQQMQAAVLHRAKDGHGTWIDGAVGIGHQLFASTPEAQFEQSPEIDSQGYVISADVRLDNRDELISLLQLDHEKQNNLTDPSLILHAYQRWGSDCPSRLLGAFAFILWDPLKQTLFGARDHLGVKPFYYYQQPNYFAVASEIKALLQSPHISDKIDPIRIADLLTSQLKDKVRTSFQDILRLPAAHQLERTADGTLKIQQYWQLDPERTIEPKSDDEYTREFQTIFTEAVQCRLRHCVPLGSQLSGGMDSSSITAIAETLLPKSEAPLRTFSATFTKVPECDETEFIQAVLDGGRFESYFVAADQSGPLTHWQDLFQILDEPALGNGYLSWLMNSEAQRQGVHIVLNGYDGDTTVGHGALYPNELAYQGKWQEALEESSLLAQRFAVEGATPLYLMRKTAFEVLTELKQQRQWVAILRSIPKIYKPLKLKPLSLFIKFLARPLWRSRPRFISSSRVSTPQTPRKEQPQLLTLFNPKFLNEFEATIQAHQAQFKSPEDGCLSVRQDQWETLSSGMMTFPMELLDQVSASFQVEPRYPFMDKRLVEFCLALPPNQKLCQGWSRYILHKSMEGILPAQVQWRGSKTNLSNAFQYGLDQYDQRILSEVLKNTERISAFINEPVVTEKWATTTNRTKLIEEFWPIITLSLWLKSNHKSRLRPQNW